MLNKLSNFLFLISYFSVFFLFFVVTNQHHAHLLIPWYIRSGYIRAH